MALNTCKYNYNSDHQGDIMLYVIRCQFRTVQGHKCDEIWTVPAAKQAAARVRPPFKQPRFLRRSWPSLAMAWRRKSCGPGGRRGRGESARKAGETYGGILNLKGLHGFYEYWAQIHENSNGEIVRSKLGHVFVGLNVRLWAKQNEILNLTKMLIKASDTEESGKQYPAHEIIGAQWTTRFV